MDAGLERVIAAETVLSRVDGVNGHLVIRGNRIEDLAERAAFEDVVVLLWNGFFEKTLRADDLQKILGAARVRAFEAMAPAFPLMANQTPMEGIRTALALTPDGHGCDEAIAALATGAVASAAMARFVMGQEPVLPSPDLGHGADLLRMIRGDVDGDLARGMNAYLVTVAEHGLNASTFVSRSVASTRAGLLSAVIGGVSALKGPLHGGAPGPVLDMLDDIGEADRAEDWIRAALDRGERLMGFGHRIYRVRDPRADALKAAAGRLPQSAGRLALAAKIETEILVALKAEKPDRVLDTNVEYYTAILLEALGIPREAFTCIFACARTAGWIAHSQEQLSTGRIVRPKAVYVGPEAMEAA